VGKRRRHRLKRRSLATIGGLLAAVVATLLLVGRSRRDAGDVRAWLAARDPAPAELNVVVLTIDTLRADRLGCYGHRGVETPFIDELARQGVVFEQSTATAPLTLPSHASIFTGLIPPHHGVRDNGGFFLDEAHTTLAERLKEAGFVTGAFLGAWVLDSRWGLAQGFDRYADKFDLSGHAILSPGAVQKRGDEVMDGALEWLEDVSPQRFFAWIHLFDPHMPHEPPEPHASRYPGRPYTGEVAYTDAVVGRLLDWLRNAGLMERTLVVLTGDHGESLGEHAESTHAYFIYDSTVAVPLIIRTPWGNTGRSRVQTSGVDVMPTILELVGLPPEEAIDGRSMAPAILDPSLALPHVAYSESYYPRFHYGWQHLRSLRDGRYKFIEAPRPELYDLETDPGETHNIHEEDPARAEELRRSLEELAGSGHVVPEREQMAPETLQRLAALGYVGDVADVDPTADLPDPKDKVSLFGLMGQAKIAAKDDRVDEAVGTMRRVIAADPKIIDAHVSLGNYLHSAGDTDGAIASFKQALTLKPDHVLALTNLAYLYRTLGRHEAALEGYRSVLEIDPRNPRAWYHCATLYLDLGRLEEATRAFRQALEHNPEMAAAYISLGAIAFARDDLEEAERVVRRALELEPELRHGRFDLARLREARGDMDGAERYYREELWTYPDSGKARFNLAQLLKRRGDRAGYLEQLRLGTERSPELGPCFFFLAREELNAGRLEMALDLATRGLAVDSASEVAPLGHYVLAEVYGRRGQLVKAQEQVRKARSLEEAIRRNPPPKI